jgi:cytochrome c-type biogenesis protein CcmE
MIADEVLAKHDENYMPPNVAESLKKTHDARRMQEASVSSSTTNP